VTQNIHYIDNKVMHNARRRVGQLWADLWDESQADVLRLNNRVGLLVVCLWFVRCAWQFHFKADDVSGLA
jgi:hypothetical protein